MYSVELLCVMNAILGGSSPSVCNSAIAFIRSRDCGLKRRSFVTSTWMKSTPASASISRWRLTTHMSSLL